MCGDHDQANLPTAPHITGMPYWAANSGSNGSDRRRTVQILSHRDDVAALRRHRSTQRRCPPAPPAGASSPSASPRLMPHPCVSWAIDPVLASFVLRDKALAIDYALLHEFPIPVGAGVVP